MSSTNQSPVCSIAPAAAPAQNWRMMRFWKLWPAACLWPATLAAQIPPPVIPEGVGVNIHFIRGHERDLDMIVAAGFKFVRMDFDWQATEPSPGTYDWSAYDDLSAQLRQRGLRAIYILDYTHSAYEPMVESRHALEPHTPEKHVASPRHPESIAAFARWAVAAAKHFRKQQVIWEIYNEPNGDFWKPKPNAAEYAALALAAAKAVRQAMPSATIIGPALSGFEWPFVETFLQSGVLEYLDAISVHPYRRRDAPPESAAADYRKLRELIDRSAPVSKVGAIPIISGEWGYSSNTRGVSVDTQAEFAVRQQLSNLLNNIPLSIWYDWKNDGLDPDENEQNFGTVTENLTPKPAYLALQTMTHELAGYKIERRIDNYGDNDFVVLFSKPHAHGKLAVWTLDEPHPIHLAIKHGAAQPEDTVLELSRMPKYIDLGDGQLK
jgi:polysaccharide biosynthesis protein PslG